MGRFCLRNSPIKRFRRSKCRIISLFRSKILQKQGILHLYWHILATGGYITCTNCLEICFGLINVCPLFSRADSFTILLLSKPSDHHLVSHYCILHVTLPNREMALIHRGNSKPHIFISSLRICLKLKTWSILCIYLMSVPLLCSYTTFPRLSFLQPDFEGFESSNSSKMCKSS
jgi:hypothetical protein